MLYKGKIGFRIFEIQKRPDKKIVKELASFPTPNIADAMGRFRVMDPGIKCITKDKTAAGIAITVMVRPGDNLMVHKAIEIAKPGDVIVVNTCGNSNNAVWGELMTLSAIKKGIVGIVVDGAVRDSEEINKLGFPVFARSIVGSACDKDGPGEINCSISCGGIAVNPGDIVVASGEGIVVISPEDAEEVIIKTREIYEKEAIRIKKIEAGEIIDPIVNKILKEKNVL